MTDRKRSVKRRMMNNQRVADFAAQLIERGRNPILAVFDAMQALDPKPDARQCVVHCVSDAARRMGRK